MASNTSLQSASQDLSQTSINILIKNNRNYIQGVGVMGAGNGGTSINAHIEYRWDFTDYTFNNTSPYTVVVQNKGIDAENYSTSSVAVNGYDLASVTTALNSLLISQFNDYTDAGRTYLSTYNDKTEFNDLYLVQAIPDEQTEFMITESGLMLITQSGDFIVSQGTTSVLFPVEIVIYPTDDPAVLVTVQDGGTGSGKGVTYGQVINSYGLNNYEVQGMYLYSPTISQLNKPLSYSSYDATGNAQIISIPNVVDPNQVLPSSVLDLSQFMGSVILDGQATVNTQVLPRNTLQMKFLTKQISSNGKLSDNFLDIERLTNTKFFEPPSAELSEFEKNDAIIVGAIPSEVASKNTVESLKTSIKEDINTIQSSNLDDLSVSNQASKIKIASNSNMLPILAIGLGIISALFLFSKDKKD